MSVGMGSITPPSMWSNYSMLHFYIFKRATFDHGHLTCILHKSKRGSWNTVLLENWFFFPAVFSFSVAEKASRPAESKCFRVSFTANIFSATRNSRKGQGCDVFFAIVTSWYKILPHCLCKSSIKKFWTGLCREDPWESDAFLNIQCL